MRVGIYARVSTHDQNTLPMQIEQMREYTKNRSWDVVLEVSEIASGAKDTRPERGKILKAAKQRKIDVILVWKLDRFGRSLKDLVTTLDDLRVLNVGFVSLTESLDFTTPSGRAMAGMLSVFAEFERDIIRERVKAGIANAKEKGKPHGRPPITDFVREKVLQLHANKWNKSRIAKGCGISRGSVINIINEAKNEQEKTKQGTSENNSLFD